MSATLLSELRDRRQHSITAAEDAYRDLVTSVADGDSVSPENAEIILQDAGRSDADLERDVSRLTEQRELREIVATKPALEKERSEISRRKQAALDRFKALQAEHQQMMQAINGELHRVEARIRATAEASRKLNESTRINHDKRAPVTPVRVSRTTPTDPVAC